MAEQIDYSRLWDVIYDGANGIVQAAFRRFAGNNSTEVKEAALDMFIDYGVEGLSRAEAVRLLLEKASSLIWDELKGRDGPDAKVVGEMCASVSRFSLEASELVSPDAIGRHGCFVAHLPH
jgi:hypothetical protein